MNNKLFLNPFVQIFKNDSDNTYWLFYPDKPQIRLSKKQIDLLLSDSIETVDMLQKHFDESDINEMKQNNYLIKEKFDLLSRDSRTEGYFFELGLLDKYEKAKNKHVLILGAGGVGSHLAWNMCALGVRNITIIDFDVVEESNLNRQLIYTYADIGKLKTDALHEYIKNHNPRCNIKTYNKRIVSKEDLYSYITSDVSLVIRAMDTPVEIANWIFSVCEDLSKPYVSGGTFGTQVILGPTYVPDKSTSYKNIIFQGENISNINSLTHVSGSIVSSNFALYKVSSEITLEATKILLDETDSLKYNSQMIIENLFEKKDQLDSTNEIKEESFILKKVISFISFAIAVMSLNTIVFGSNLYTISYSLGILSLVTYLYWNKTEIHLYKSSIICGAIAGLGNVPNAMVFINRDLLLASENILSKVQFIAAFIFAGIVFTCFHVMIMTFLVGCIKAVDKNFISKQFV